MNVLHLGDSGFSRTLFGGHLVPEFSEAEVFVDFIVLQSPLKGFEDKIFVVDLSTNSFKKLAKKE